MLRNVLPVHLHIAKFLPDSSRQSLDRGIWIALLRRFSVMWGREINIPPGGDLGAPYNPSIGDNSAIRLDCYLGCLDRVTINLRAILLPGMFVGKWCTVSVGADVTLDMAGYSTVADIPAMHIQVKSTTEQAEPL